VRSGSKTVLVAMLLLAALTVTGCQSKTLGVPAGRDGGSRSAEAADLTPAGLSKNTTPDVDAAKAALETAVPDARLTSGLTRAPSAELTPRDWWDAHNMMPYKIVIFVADAPKNAKYLYTVYTVVQSRVGLPWFLYKTEQGTG